jgi:hypothetical protein
VQAYLGREVAEENEAAENIEGDEFHVSEGLSQQEAAQLLRDYGRNELTEVS